MEIQKKKTGSKLEYALIGRLDTTTAPELEAAVKSDLGDVTELVFDFSALDYVSSAGLRVLLLAQKMMSAKGTMTLTKVKPEVMEVFEITGFNDILTFA